MIRHATAADIDALVPMAWRFIQFAPHAPMVGATDDQVRASIAMVIEHGVILVAEQGGALTGMLMGILNPIWFAPATRCAVELAWWIEPEHRGGMAAIRLVNAFEEWAKAQGAAMVTMCDLVVDGQPPVGDIIMRLGYTPSERTFVKGL